MNGNNLFSVSFFDLLWERTAVPQAHGGAGGCSAKALVFPGPPWLGRGALRQYLVIPILELANPLTGLRLAIGAMVVIEIADPLASTALTIGAMVIIKRAD